MTHVTHKEEAINALSYAKGTEKYQVMAIIAVGEALLAINDTFKEFVGIYNRANRNEGSGT